MNIPNHFLRQQTCGVRMPVSIFHLTNDFNFVFWVLASFKVELKHEVNLDKMNKKKKKAKQIRILSF